MKNNISKKYWSGEGRKIISIPPQVLKKQQLSNTLLKNLYITDLGYYPHASEHYTHRAKGCPENILIYCVAGSGWMRAGKKKYTVDANHFFMLPQHTEHEYGASESDPWTIYWIRFGGVGLSGLNDISDIRECFVPKHFSYKPDAVQLFHKIFNVLTQGYSKQYLVYVNMMLVNFLSLFLFQHEPATKRKVNNQYDKLIQKAISYMQANLHEVNIPMLAKTVGCSSSKLFSVFKTHTGYSPINYFNHLKIQSACQELETTDALIKEIAAGLGYDDPYYFSRLFTKLMGVSPNIYRKRNAQKQ